jgi:transposase
MVNLFALKPLSILQKYPNDFKQEAVALATEQGYSVVEAAASLNITNKLLYNRIAKSKLQQEDFELSTDERAELIQLRKDKTRLKMEREILKKASEDSSHQPFLRKNRVKRTK